MDAQPPFLSKIVWTTIFNNAEVYHLQIFDQENGLHHKSKNVIYGKETFVGWGVLVSSRWPMATQPPFLLKIVWMTIFNNSEGKHIQIFDQEMVTTKNPRMWSMARKHMWGEVYEPLVDD
jgi:hypothetical protein